MARIRTIKPEFWLDEDLSELSCETHMLAAALLNHCDDEGYFKANPKLLHAQIFALRELDGSVTELVQSLSEIGYLTLFNGTDGKFYGHVTNFNKHQTINKATASKIKGLKQLPSDYGSATEQLPLGKERKGKEQGKEQGKESKPSISSKSPCDDIPQVEIEVTNIKNINSGYAFQGDVIRLSQKDFNTWQALYSNLNLHEELKQLDMELRGEKKWFQPASAKLNYRNKVKNNKYQSQGKKTVTENFSEKDYGETVLPEWMRNVQGDQS
jgi:hypothetical protein